MQTKRIPLVDRYGMTVAPGVRPRIKRCMSTPPAAAAYATVDAGKYSELAAYRWGAQRQRVRAARPPKDPMVERDSLTMLHIPPVQPPEVVTNPWRTESRLTRDVSHVAVTYPFDGIAVEDPSATEACAARPSACHRGLVVHAGLCDVQTVRDDLLGIGNCRSALHVEVPVRRGDDRGCQDYEPDDDC